MENATTLTPEQNRKLDALRFRATTYELVASKGDQHILLGYGANRSRNMLHRIVTKHALRLVALTGSESITFAERADDGATMGEWRIAFTRRTHREAIMHGELPYIGKMEIGE